MTGWQVLPPGQSLVAVQLPLARSHRQIARQVLLLPMRLQTSPVLQSAPPGVQLSPISLTRVGPGQVQSTWSIPASATQARLVGQPPRVAVAARRGSQLNVQVWYGGLEAGAQDRPLAEAARTAAAGAERGAVPAAVAEPQADLHRAADPRIVEALRSGLAVGVAGADRARTAAAARGAFVAVHGAVHLAGLAVAAGGGHQIATREDAPLGRAIHPTVGVAAGRRIDRHVDVRDPLGRDRLVRRYRGRAGTSRRAPGRRSRSCRSRPR